MGKRPTDKATTGTFVMRSRRADMGSTDKTYIGWFIIWAGVFAGLMLFVAGILLFVHGENLVDLRSAATAEGETASISETYYNEMGYCNQGYGVAAIGLGAGIIATSVGLGASYYKKSPFTLLNDFVPTMSK